MPNVKMLNVKMYICSIKFNLRPIKTCLYLTLPRLKILV